MSESMREFLVAALDLLHEVKTADEVLVTDEIREAAERLDDVVGRNRGEL